VVSSPSSEEAGRGGEEGGGRTGEEMVGLGVGVEEEVILMTRAGGRTGGSMLRVRETIRKERFSKGVWGRG